MKLPRTLSGWLDRLTNAQKVVYSGVLVGVAAGFAAYLLGVFIDLFRDHTIAVALALHRGVLRPFLTALLPALGALLGALVIRYLCPEAGGRGLTPVLDAVRVKEGRISGHVAWAKLLASATTIGFGGSAGREGPVIHIGAAVGSRIGQILRLNGAELKMLVSAGAAAGLAASFGVPLTAVFFTMEVLTRDFAGEAFAAVVIAAATGAATAHLLIGSSQDVLRSAYGWRQPQDLAWYGVIALVCAPLGRFYMKLVEDVEHRSDEPAFARLGLALPALGGILAGLLGLAQPGVLGSGQSLIEEAVRGHGPTGLDAAALTLGKLGATAATLGFGGSGGAFMPALFIGGTAGGAVHSMLAWVSPAAPPVGALALAGMACVITTAYTAPITGIALGLELSRDYDMLAPIMLAVAVSYVLAGRRAKESPVVDR